MDTETHSLNTPTDRWTVPRAGRQLRHPTEPQRKEGTDSSLEKLCQVFVYISSVLKINVCSGYYFPHLLFEERGLEPTFKPMSLEIKRAQLVKRLLVGTF